MIVNLRKEVQEWRERFISADDERIRMSACVGKLIEDQFTVSAFTNAGC